MPQHHFIEKGRGQFQRGKSPGPLTQDGKGTTALHVSPCYGRRHLLQPLTLALTHDPMQASAELSPVGSLGLANSTTTHVRIQGRKILNAALLNGGADHI